ncbi:hypothetical protein DY000_02008483 [Brassica cretica]|uniref:Wall-associated receptor kinase galacturonan-binding domain-containing protein n=1 Tax=Brassica cretica TaxID=69181 RepID=A0ABQ7C2L2_BRACR|nr:hypothetical protein DY000_02008483 [Brassica cretica]
MDFASAFHHEFPAALPNCIDQCNRAGVRVPYPFGIGKGCYKSKWFEVVCNHSLHLSFPFLPSIGLDVISFSLTDDFIYEDRSHKSNGFQIQSPRKTSGCSYGKKDVQSLNLTGSPFFISDNNKFTAVGCNIKAILGCMCIDDLTGWKTNDLAHPLHLRHLHHLHSQNLLHFTP